MAIPLFQVDAFTDVPFRGNPAAVCLLDGPRGEGWMRRVAAEMNLSETAFLVPRDGAWDLRWFTPRVEVDLCGHATLAAAHVLWEERLASPDESLRFLSASGPLAATLDGVWIELDFPAEPPEEVEPPDRLQATLGATPVWIGRNRLDWLVELATEGELSRIRPDAIGIAALGARGVIVTAVSSSEERDFVSRYFAPSAGIDEDPVTGSAHCALAPYWSKRTGKDEMVGYQASERGGTVRVRTASQRVFLAGQAVTVVRGELLV